MWNLQALKIRVCFLGSLRKKCGRRRKRRFFDDRNLWTISRTAAYLGYGVAQKAGKAYVFAAAASFGGGDFGAVSADDVADGLIFWCDAKGAAGDFGFGLRRPCLCFGGRAKCFGADVAAQAHADEVLAVSFGDAGHDVDLKKGWCI